MAHGFGWRAWLRGRGVSRVNRWGQPLALVCSVTLLSTAPGGAQATRELFPNTTDLGRAAAEYEDDVLQVVAAYYYSQRHHDSRWLLIEIAAASAEPMRIRRGDITLVTPEGRVVSVASQRAVSEDRERIRLLRQNAVTTRHPVASYLRGRATDRFQWFVTSAAEGTVTDIFDVDQHRAALGDLYFASPTGAWEEGTYSLVVEGVDARATLPIDLD